MINFKIEKMDIGEQVRAGVSRYYAVSNFYNEKDKKQIIKNFLRVR